MAERKRMDLRLRHAENKMRNYVLAYKSLKIYSKGNPNPAVEMIPKKVKGQKFITRDEIEAASVLVEQKYPGRKYEVVVHRKNWGWKPGDLYEAGETPKLFDPSHYYDTKEERLK